MNKWQYSTISNLFSIKTGTTPSTRSAEYWDGGTVNWITPTDLSHNEGKAYISGSERKVTRKALEENNLTMLPKKALILSTRAPVGYVAVLENEAVFNQGCKGLVPKTELSPEFYYYCLISKQKLLDNRSSGSTFKELAKDVLEKVELPFPPLPEQKEIVEILSTVDERIERTENNIKKIEELKDGLLGKLFTGKDWVEAVFGEIGDFQYGYTASSMSENTGVQFLRITDITDSGIIDWDQVPFCRIDKVLFENYKLAKGDVLFARLGATAGKTATIESDVNAVFASYLIRFRANNNVLSKFVFYFTQSKLYWGQALRQREGQFKKGLNANMLSKFAFVYPKSTQEQEKIVKVLSEVDARLENEKSIKEKLGKIKNNLMNNLLSGKKRVRLS